MDWEIKRCDFMPIDDLLAFEKEFIDNGEKCNVLMRMSEIGAYALADEMRRDPHTVIAGYYLDGMLIGIARFTKNPTYEANGKFGYAIRPSMRGKGYAMHFVDSATRYAFEIGITEVTACVDENNAISQRVLERYGYEKTGRSFQWFPDPMPRTAIEYERKAM